MQSNVDSGTKAVYFVFVGLWAAILVSQFLLLLLIYFVKSDIFDADTPSQPRDVVYILAAMSAIVFVASFVLRKILHSHASKSKAAALVFVASILGCSLCEAVSLFGLVSAFVANYPYFFVFFLAGISGTIFHFPSQSALAAANSKY